jgi:ribosomal protein L28
MIIQKKHILYLLTVEAINIFLKLLLVAGCCTSMICVSTNLGTAIHVNNFFTYLCVTWCTCIYITFSTSTSKCHTSMSWYPNLQAMHHTSMSWYPNLQAKRHTSMSWYPNLQPCTIPVCHVILTCRPCNIPVCHCILTCRPCTIPVCHGILTCRPCTIPVCHGILTCRPCTIPIHYSCNVSQIKIVCHTGTALHIFTFTLFSIFLITWKAK